MKKLKTVDADTLLYQPLEKPSFVVDGLIPTGLTLLCGAQKICKSWLMLKLCLCVLEGRPLWELPTTPEDVLYLCLEDTFYRIQDRLFRLADEASERLLFAVASCKLTDGLVGQLEDYLKERPGTRLIVIGTLQKVRTASRAPMPTTTGTYRCSRILRTGTPWRWWSSITSASRGTATELLTRMGETDTAPNVITKLLNEYHATILRQNNVRYVYRRTKAGRRIVLSRGDG